ncbi:SAM-dependent methyltransferase [Richelia intracellularis HH01]|uniref:SAM-dependent methyltransferase n=1 Tax=Richelia intracellularis HH01 TaxID=1165094 RepID=M1WRM2_9NOST|nr:MnmC family methyltransferase [Richelia intracellularis]CCH67014.1 SAM-dependent methyltransferase [Richelia intracellularis HH01]
MKNAVSFIPQMTADSSFTFFSAEFSEYFHSRHGARQESFGKFVIPTQLAIKAKQQSLRILDICYGLGYNTAAALETIWTINPDCHVELIGLEINLCVPQSAVEWGLSANWSTKYTDVLRQLAFTQHINSDHLTAKLLMGDARNLIQSLSKSGFCADAIFLDPFSLPKCPQLWTVEFIRHVTQCLHFNGLLATYSCAAAIRTAFITAGLSIASTHPVGRLAPGTIGGWTLKSNAYLPLSQQEQEHLLTNAAVPYRDPQLNDSADSIIKRRIQEQKYLSLEPTSHWRKRWSQFKS